MRWLLLKDLQLLRRSPVIAALLVVYPIVIAVLIGFALSRSPDDPRVAFLNQVPPDASTSIGDRRFDQDSVRAELCERIECVPVESVEEARRMVEDGDVLAALIIPPDLVDRLRSLTGLDPERPMVTVLVNDDDPLKAEIVDDRIDSLVGEANLLVAREIARQAGTYLDLVVGGGSFDLPLLGGVEILGLERAAEILDGVREELPDGSPAAGQLDRVIRFARLAGENLDFALPILDAVAEPIEVDRVAVTGEAPALDSFAIAVAATLTLMLVTVLLVAGSLALEREENAFGRLVRGLVSKGALLLEKLALGVVVSLFLTLLMLAAITPFVPVDWGRFAIWVPAILAGGAGFAAFGAAVGAATRDVRASALLAFMVSLPVAFLSLVPSGSVGAALQDAIDLVAFAFPFDAALRAMQGALDAAGPSVPLAVVHLLGLAIAYGVLARLALRRFA